MLPDNPTRQGEAEDLLQDATAAAQEEAQQREEQAHEAEAEAIRKNLQKAKISEKEIASTDPALISPEDLDFLNSK